jgi:phosphatidylserine/phosphatidylglycerophosphate/cardiolipin synthase-like enzyme
MRALMHALQHAEHFVHFTTYGISALIVGALRLTAQRVTVRGVVSGVRNEAMLRELTSFHDEAPDFHIRVMSGEDGYFPHQKIVIIDGLLAFKGSANMTDYGWRKAAEGREVIDAVTDNAEVVDLNNRFFSPIWAGEAHAGDRILMTVY